jgi:hypothetical protein
MPIVPWNPSPLRLGPVTAVALIRNPVILTSHDYGSQDSQIPMSVARLQVSSELGRTAWHDESMVGTPVSTIPKSEYSASIRSTRR